MDLHAQDRDPFPKTKLQGGYLGDGYPLCAELPNRAFLLRGAKYEKTGAKSLLMGTKFDNLAGDTNETVRPHFAPSARGSQLYADAGVGVARAKHGPDLAERSSRAVLPVPVYALRVGAVVQPY